MKKHRNGTKLRDNTSLSLIFLPGRKCAELSIKWASGQGSLYSADTQDDSI